MPITLNTTLRSARATAIVTSGGFSSHRNFRPRYRKEDYQLEYSDVLRDIQLKSGQPVTDGAKPAVKAEVKKQTLRYAPSNVNTLLPHPAPLVDVLAQYRLLAAARKQRNTARSEEINRLIMYNIRARAALLAA